MRGQGFAALRWVCGGARFRCVAETVVIVERWVAPHPRPLSLRGRGGQGLTDRPLALPRALASGGSPGQEDAPEQAVRGALVEPVGQGCDQGRGGEAAGEHEGGGGQRRAEQFHHDDADHRHQERVQQVGRIAGIAERVEDGRADRGAVEILRGDGEDEHAGGEAEGEGFRV